jgi:ATP-dependent exoDNAse (exonuclease V) beta subunit
MKRDMPMTTFTKEQAAEIEGLIEQRIKEALREAREAWERQGRLKPREY